MGRSNNIAWGLTAALIDNSDLWEEEINEAGTHYYVDGEWRQLQILNEVIKVKGKPDMNIQIRLTHRGPLMGIPELRFNSGLLFGGTVPEMEDISNTEYSLGWGGAVVGDHSIRLLNLLRDSESVPEFRTALDEMTERTGYRGVAANMMMADNSGNIAY